MIFIEKDTPLPLDELEEKLEYLRRAVETGDDEKTRAALRLAVPTFRAPSEINKDASEAEEMKEAKQPVAVG